MKPEENKKTENQAEQPGEIRFTAAELVPFVKDSWNDTARELAAIKKKLGVRYNVKNEYERVVERFCDPVEFPERWVQEYILIINKKSKLSASVRRPIYGVVSNAFNKLYAQKRKEHDTKRRNRASSPKE